MEWCFEQNRIADFVRKHIPYSQDFGEFAAIGLKHKGEVVCGVVYNEHRPEGDIRMHNAATHPMWCRPQYLNGFFDYPFNQLGCKRVTGIVREDQAGVQSFDQNLGFQYEGRIRKGFGDYDALIYGMLREECRWIGKKLDFWLYPEMLIPIHEAWDDARLTKIQDDMERNGWCGDPVLVLKTDRNYALTGTHRIEAARRAGILVKVSYVQNQLITDETFYKLLREAGDMPAAALIEKEMKKGNISYG